MSELMKRLAAKVRGLVGLGLLGGAAGFMLGGVWGVVSSALRSGIFLDVGYLRFLLDMAWGNALGFAQVGAFTTAGFGVLVAAIDSRRSLVDLPLWRMGLFGALAGAVFPPLIVVWRIGLAAYLDAAVTLLPVSVAIGLIGGLATASMVAVAKRADRLELPTQGEPMSQLEGL
jgi:hypothetical protein